MNESPRESPPPPDAPNLNVLAYHGPSPLGALRPSAVASRVSYERVLGALVITVPAPPVVVPVVAAALIVISCGLPAMALLTFDGFEVFRNHSVRSEDLCVWAGMTPFVLAAIWAIRRIMFMTKGGRLPTVIRVRPEGLEIDARGSLRPVRHTWAAGQIADVSIRVSGGLLAGFMPVLLLQLVLDDGQVCRVPIPWRHGDPMIEVEDNLRDVLGLPPSTG
jgi:hypothetical protein